MHDPLEDPVQLVLLRLQLRLSHVDVVPDKIKDNKKSLLFSSVWNKELIGKLPSEIIYEHQVHSKRVTTIHKYENKMISSGYDGDIVIGQSKRISIQKPIIATAINSSGILYASVLDMITSCSISTGKILNEFKGHDDRISSIECPSPNIIVTGS